jgi:hypothetical protein
VTGSAYFSKPVLNIAVVIIGFHVEMILHQKATGTEALQEGYVLLYDFEDVCPGFNRDYCRINHIFNDFTSAHFGFTGFLKKNVRFSLFSS